MKLISYIALVAAIFIFSRCAQQMAPSGGGRDLYPPTLDTNKLTPAIPANFSTNFKANQIVLQFNEYFVLDKPIKNIIITPVLSQNPSYRIKGKKLIIGLGEGLKDSTTYTINFGAAIKDITEGNVTKNFNYVFSTGSYIDSLSFKGTVYDAFTRSGVENATVMLYEENTDSIPFKEKPMYFVKTNKSGNFTMEYLKAGKYKAVALLDENNNYLFSPKSEAIAFSDNQIEIPQSVTDTLENRFLLFKEDLKKQFVLDNKYMPQGKVNLTMNRSSDDLVISGINGLNLNPTWINYSVEKDSIEFWIDTNETKEKFFSILIDDKSNGYTDTIKITTPTPKKAQPSPFIIAHNAKKGLENNSDLSLLFNKPLSKIDDSKMKLELREEEVPFSVTQNSVREVTVSSRWIPGKKYVLTLYPNAFTNILGESTDTVKVSFKYKEEKDYGKLLLNIEVEEGDYILQLLKEGKEVGEKTFKGDTFKYDYNQLGPGKYQLKLIYDKNSNSKWDTGIYLKHLQPETVLYYNGEISIRQGWDIDVTWKL